MHLTWYGHSAFRVDLSEASVLIDPFLTGNPVFTGSVDEVAEGVTHIVLTHGHADHIGDTVALAARTGATVVANPELCGWLASKGVKSLEMGNTGGTINLGAFSVTFVQALHSSAVEENGLPVYLGNPLGVIIKAAGEPVLYHMGDTDVFGDMRLIDDLYRPEIGLVPIGDRFTMGAHNAAFACSRFFSFRLVVPCHYGTFPLLAQSADVFVEEMSGSRTVVHVPEKNERFSPRDYF
ncbi:L-ascorbate metabolism protein UlaG, beta-lactamase superfamily [Pseudoxanthobacter soli DSM 19599]|uniref:UPF0173 metal-dependent hydrolase SAMN02745172_03709 n=1 Tax=Pseudoxanthobacter soli DSM 19599 TaxID=1123029 RepID=A0A1M7ZQX0_9HYPH|nr:metal-dependent hydrolase [Pseudoxanthobacter soli]SHO67046.1 L-ascorbate metabolism protein UlaG, beta-lactamase superfamily [Pseudoxanthobacter soli DSM 19599]